MSEIVVTVQNAGTTSVDVVDGSSVTATVGNGGFVDVSLGSVSSGNANVVSGTLTIGNVETLAAGTSAYVTNKGTAYAAVIDIGLPAGATGPQGAAGVTPALSIGTVSTLAAGSSATAKATASNNGANVTLDFGIPQGAAGTATTDASLLTSGTLADARLSANVPLLVNGLVPAAMLPSYVDDVIDAGGSLPATGEAGKIYFLSSGASVNKVYRWGGTAFVEIVSSPGSTDAVPEGSTNLYFTTQRAAAAAPVQSLNSLTGAITLAAGSNVSITPSGSTLTIASGGIGENDTVDGGNYTGQVP